MTDLQKKWPFRSHLGACEAQEADEMTTNELGLPAPAAGKASAVTEARIRHMSPELEA